MQVSAVQNYSNNSTQKVHAQKTSFLAYATKDLTTGSFSKESSFKGSPAKEASATGSMVGLSLGILAAGILTCLVPIAAPLVVTMVAPILTGGAIGSHIDKKIDEANARKNPGK